MKMYQRGLVAMVFAANAIGAMSARASEVVSIPWSAALQTSPSPDDCIPYLPYVYGSTSNECYLTFPLSIPVGHTILGIAVTHGTDNMFPGGQPFFFAYLDVSTLVPATNDVEKFIWTSSSVVPSGTFDKHPLMTHLDQFPVLPNTIYQVVVGLANGADVAGIEVTYN